MEGPPRTYVGGLVNHWDHYDPDIFSILVLEDYLEQVGYTRYKACSYLVPDPTLDNGLKRLKNDYDIMKMLEDIKGHVDEGPSNVWLDLNIYTNPFADVKYASEELCALENSDDEGKKKWLNELYNTICFI